MSISIDIVPFSDSLDMYGEPDTSSAYSLSGHVSISITSTSSMFESRRAVRLLLRSLSVTFEGQSEVISPEFGYAPLRLCSVTRELAPIESIELNNEGHEDSDKPCTWNVIFDLPIPGWLPATAVYGDAMYEEAAGTRYSLFATANFDNLDDSSDKTWSLATLCSVFRPRTKVVHAQKRNVTLRRLVVPPSIPPSPDSLFPMINFAIRTKPEFANAARDSSFIPLDVLSSIQVLASVPDHIGVDDASVPFAIRLRTSNLPEAECKRLRIKDFSVNMTQTEKYRALPPVDSSSRYPIPSSSSQPPNKPLLEAHPFSRLYDVGLVNAAVSPHSTVNRSYSILSPAESGNFELSGDGYVFADDWNTTEEGTWYTINSSVPLAQRGASSSRQTRPSGSSPLFSVRHEMQIELTCTYDAPDTSERITERLHFTLPLQLSNISSTAPSRSASPPPSLCTSQSTPPLPLSSSEPLGQPEMVPYSLPAYSQLFDSNGDRKIDYSLPVYTPNGSPSSKPIELDAPPVVGHEGKLSVDRHERLL